MNYNPIIEEFLILLNYEWDIPEGLILHDDPMIQIFEDGIPAVNIEFKVEHLEAFITYTLDHCEGALRLGIDYTLRSGDTLSTAGTEIIAVDMEEVIEMIEQDIADWEGAIDGILGSV
jgi:hypothetical protein